MAHSVLNIFWTSSDELDMKKLILLATISLTACASTGIIPVGKDTYMVSKRSAQAGFGPPVGARADLYKEANEFCAKTGKTLETVKSEMTNSGFAKPGSASLEFRCTAATTPN